MRTLTASLLAACLIGAGGSRTFGQSSAGGGDKPKDPAAAKEAPAKVEKAAAPTLEEMLTRALKDNPDIRVAEAKVREADAELNRVRLLVTQKVIALQRSLESQRALVELADKDLKRYREAGRAGQVADAQERLTQAKTKLAEVEAEMPYLLGKPPQAEPKGGLTLGYRENLLWPQNYNAIESSFHPNVMNPFYNRFGAGPNVLSPYMAPNWGWAAALHPPATPAVGSAAERLRKALDVPVRMQVSNQPLADVLHYLEEKAPGLAFRILDAKDKQVSELAVSLTLHEVPTGAVLQALQDSFPGLSFVVREYGVLVTWADRVPPGALRLDSFWKADAEKRPPGKESPAGKPGTTPEVKGTILDTLPDSSLVVVSIGGDAGLSVGQTLHAYRTGPKPEYLGQVEVTRVESGRAIAKPHGRLHGTLQTGDVVSTSRRPGNEPAGAR
jgi:hypothetical protein